MFSIGKSLALILILIMAISSLSLLMVKPANAQTPTPTPYPTTFSSTLAIPEFTIRLADHSYDVPPTTTTTTDPYTGKQITTTQAGYHVENKTIDITITNQPHISVFAPEEYAISLYYDIRFKGHFGDNWTELYGYDEEENLLLPATNSTYTSISIPQSNYPSDAQVDFQTRVINGTFTSYPRYTIFGYWTYQASGWSNTQTIIIPATSTSSPTPTLNVPEFPTLIILPLLAVIILISLVFKRKKITKK
jgi:hypothetical protein